MRECPKCNEFFWNSSLLEMHMRYCGREKAVKHTDSSFTNGTVSTEFMRMKIRRKVADSTMFDVPALSNIAVEFNRDILNAPEAEMKVNYGLEASKMLALVFSNVILAMGYYFLV
jgi:hypothetical protein